MKAIIISFSLIISSIAVASSSSVLHGGVTIEFVDGRLKAGTGSVAVSAGQARGPQRTGAAHRRGESPRRRRRTDVGDADRRAAGWAGQVESAPARDRFQPNVHTAVVRPL